MKCQILFPGMNKKNITNLSSAELAQRVMRVTETLMRDSKSCFFFLSIISLDR